MRRWIAIALIGFVVLSGCAQSNAPNAPDEIPGTPESGPAYLGGITVDNKNNVSATINIRILQNETIVYQKTVTVPPKTDIGDIPFERPNASGSFVVEARLKGQPEWKQVNSTDEGLRGGGCFGVSIIVRQTGQLDVFPAGRCI